MRRAVSVCMSILLAVVSVCTWPFAPGASAATVLSRTLVSTTPSGTAGNNDSFNSLMTPNGRYVTFSSYATDITSDTLPPGMPQVFLLDRQNNTRELVSRTTSGNAGNQDSYPLGISDDGRFVLMRSSSTNFPDFPQPDTLGGSNFVYLRDRQAGTLTRIGDPAFLNVTSDVHFMSADGNTILYTAITSYNWNNSNPQVTYGYYKYDRTTGTSTPIPAECLHAISANGQYSTCRTGTTIELYNLATGQRTEILQGYAATYPEIYLSADATRALFYASNATNTGYDLQFADLTTGQVTTVATNLHYSGIGMLSLSADNKIAGYVTYSTPNGTTSKEAWVADVTTGEKLKVDQGGANVYPITVSADGTEVAYNTSSAATGFMSQVYVAKIGNSDTVAPTVTGTPDRAPNAAGWYNANVTIDWTATDPSPSSGAPTQPNDTVASTEGEHAYTSSQSCDPAGNCATGSLTLKIDKTQPTITASQTPAPNAAGWNKTNTTVTFTCADAHSGIQSCSSPVTVSTEGANQVVTGTATDVAGNTKTITATVKLDKTAPTTSNPSMANWFFWFGGSTQVSANAADALSGVAKGEYYIDTDPGQGSGTPLAYANGMVSGTATIPANLSFGVHRLYIRSMDTAGNWSASVSVAFFTL